MSAIRVVLADDHPMYRHGAAAVLADEPRVELVGQATSGTELLDLLAAGQRNSRIAAELGLSDKTVRNHLSSILAKLQVEDRSAAIVRAREAGLGR
jgi:DNA-binding NarL/FixJ family response regulator